MTRRLSIRNRPKSKFTTSEVHDLMKRAAFAVLLFIAPLTAFASVPTQAVIVMMKPTGRVAAKAAVTFDPRVSADERDLRELPAINGFAANLTDEDIAEIEGRNLNEPELVTAA